MKPLKTTSTELESEELAQYELGLREPFSNRLHNLKAKVRLTFKHLETRRFIKAPYTWVLIFATISLLLVQLTMIQSNLSTLPSTIPLLKYSIDLKDRLVQRETLYAIPAISFMILVINTTASYKVFNSRPYLTLIGLFSMFVGVLLITLSVAVLINQFKI